MDAISFPLAHFNPRTPCGVRLSAYASTPNPEKFQSTHPVWGATTPLRTKPLVVMVFQSTHPVWGATRHRSPTHAYHLISIHAPRVGCDPMCPTWTHPRRNFNPRTPCGVRHLGEAIARKINEFQSTHPVWGATRGLPSLCRPVWNFNPRTPCGVRLFPTQAGNPQNEFQSTHPVWGATLVVILSHVSRAISIHAPRVGCDC